MPVEWNEISAVVINDVVIITKTSYHMVDQLIEDDVNWIQIQSGIDTTEKTQLLEPSRLLQDSENGGLTKWTNHFTQVEHVGKVPKSYRRICDNICYSMSHNNYLFTPLWA